MLKVIVGENSSGKTLYLNNLLSDLGESVCTSNIPNREVVFNKIIHEGRLDTLGYVVCTDVYADIYGLRITDMEITLSPEFLRVAEIICIDRDYLILDEPDLCMPWKETIMLYVFIEKVAHTFKDVYVATHRDNLLGARNASYYIMSDNLILNKVTEDEAYEHVNPI